MPVAIGGIGPAPIIWRSRTLRSRWTFGRLRGGQVRISAASTEYIEVPISARFMGQPYDPTVDPVYFAFKSDGTTPSGGDFTAGTWETDATVTPNIYYARLLVGPVSPGLVLAKGSYLVWVKLTDNPEVLVRPVDQLVVW